MANQAIPDITATHDRKLVQSKRPDYESMIRRFTFLRDSVEGSGGYEDYLGAYFSESGNRISLLPLYTYLRRHPRESNDRWRRRRETAYYVNFVGWILGVALGLLTRETPKREGYPKPLLDWMDENKFENIRALLYWWALCYGELYALVDRPHREEMADSAAGVDDDGPYIRVIHPDNVWDLEYENGELLWLKYAQDLKEKADPLTKRKTGKMVWVLTRDGWWNYKLWDNEKGSNLVEVNASGEWDGKVKGRVPVAVFKSRDETIGGMDRPPAFIEPPARIMKRLHNVISFKGQTQDSSCVPFFVVPVKDHAELMKLNIGSSSAIPDDPLSSKSAHFATYDTGPIQLLAEEQDRLVLLMKQVVSLAFDENAVATSGIAKSYAFLQLNVTLAAQVTALEEFEMAIVDLVSRFEGRDGLPDGAKVGMTKRFDIADVQADIEQGIKLLDAEYGPLARKAIKSKMLLEKYLQDTPAAEKKDLEAELEAESTAEADEPDDGDDEPETPGGQPGIKQPKLPAAPLKPR